MTIRSAFGGLGVAVVCTALSGCMMPCGYGGGGCCGPQSLSARAPVRGAMASACDDGACGAAACDAPCGTTCDTACCSPCNFPILSALNRMLTCDAGCGRMYWGEWCYDPPDACDPCDDCGNWTGPGPCPSRGCGGLWGLLCGARFHDPCGMPGCDECSDGACDAPIMEGEMSDESWTDVLDPHELGPDVMTVEPAEPSLGARPRPAPRDPNSRLVRRSRTPVMH